MSDRTTYFGPRVSFRTSLADPGPVHVHVPSNGTLDVDGTFLVNGVSMTSAVTASGPVTMSGNVNVTGSFAVGSGTSIAAIRGSRVSLSPGAVAAHESLVTSVFLNTMPLDAIVVSVTPAQASLWSGAYYDIGYTYAVSSVSTLDIGFHNSTTTSVTLAAMNWDVWWIDPS